MEEEVIASKEIRREFGDMVKVEDAWRNRKLMLIGRIARIECTKDTRKLLMASCADKRRRGYPFREIRD